MKKMQKLKADDALKALIRRVSSMFDTWEMLKNTIEYNEGQDLRDWQDAERHTAKALKALSQIIAANFESREEMHEFVKKTLRSPLSIERIQNGSRNN